MRNQRIGARCNDGLGDRISIDVRAKAQIDRWRLPPDTEKILGVLGSDRRPQRIAQPRGNRDGRRKPRNLRTIGCNLAKNRIREAGNPLATFHAYELHGVVDHGVGRDALEMEQLIRGA